MIIKDATESRGYIATRSLIKTINFITVIVFPEIIQRQVLASWNTKIVWNKYSIDCFSCLP